MFLEFLGTFRFILNGSNDYGVSKNVQLFCATLYLQQSVDTNCRSQGVTEHWADKKDRQLVWSCDIEQIHVSSNCAVCWMDLNLALVDCSV